MDCEIPHRLEWCASKDARASKEVDVRWCANENNRPLRGWIVRSHIDWSDVPTRTLGPKERWDFEIPHQLERCVNENIRPSSE